MMTTKYRSTLCESKKLNGTGLLQRANASNITADKILYDHAIQMVSNSIFGYFSTFFIVKIGRSCLFFVLVKK